MYITLVVVRPHPPASSPPGASQLHCKPSRRHWLHSCQIWPCPLSGLILSVFSAVPGFQPHCEHTVCLRAVCLPFSAWNSLFPVLTSFSSQLKVTFQRSLNHPIKNENSKKKSLSTQLNLALYLIRLPYFLHSIYHYSKSYYSFDFHTKMKTP